MEQFFLQSAQPDGVLPHLRIEGYIRYIQNTIRRMTEQPCMLPESSTGERAAALIRVLSEIGALELLEE